MSEPTKEEKAAAQKAADEAKAAKAAADVAEAELKKVEDETRALEAKQRIVLAKAKLHELRAAQKLQDARDAAVTAAKRAQSETVKEGDMAIYVLKEKSYKPPHPGAPFQILEAGSLIRLHKDALPGGSMAPVKRGAAAQAGFVPLEG